MPRFLPRIHWKSEPPPDSDSGTIQEVLPGFVGDSGAIRQALAMATLYAQTNASILITGESGTGKEICARAIHTLSPRASRPFVPVNCGSLGLELLNNELFGHEKGAYTGAERSFGGLVAQADGGTLFLDEIDSIPPPGQVKLLRFLQESEFRAVGAGCVRHANVRLLFATNCDLRKCVAQGHMREDFLYRLGSLHLHLPPLRERPGDVPLLARRFLHKYSLKHGKAVRDIAPDALCVLSWCPWPGNARQLEHVIERAVLVCMEDTLQARDLEIEPPAPAIHSSSPKSFREKRNTVLEDFEVKELGTLLARNQGNVARAAAEAQMDYGNFYRLLRKHRFK